MAREKKSVAQNTEARVLGGRERKSPSTQISLLGGRETLEQTRGSKRKGHLVFPKTAPMSGETRRLGHNGHWDRVCRVGEERSPVLYRWVIGVPARPTPEQGKNN